MERLWKAVSRRRKDTEGEDGESELARVLGFLDLTALGVGSTLGLGVYVLAGSVAKETAGPAVCISFLIAAIASAFAGMCYAEFAARVPKAGSAYVYSYVTVGELIAFVIGWNLILEYVIGTASAARGLSGYLDILLDNALQKSLRSAMPIDVPFLSEYPDFFAFVMILLLVCLLCVGVKESSLLNKIFTTVNLATICVVIVAGSIKADIKNWQINPEEIPANATSSAIGTGGFMPFGISGVMVGAAKCFYGFVGFDAVATTGEEAKNPQKNIPLAIVASLVIIFVAYFSISTVLTMVWPYYDQNPNAPFPYVFEQIGWPVIKWIVNVGAIFALCTSLLGAMFPLPRVIYAMGSDGLVFTFLAKVHPRTMTPVVGTIVSGLLTGLMSLIFNLQQLIDMMSIGTLLAYTIVAVCVLILRYQKKESLPRKFSGLDEVPRDILSPSDMFRQIFNLHNVKEPTEFSEDVAKWGIVLFSIAVFVFTVLLNSFIPQVTEGNILVSIVLAILLLVAVLIVLAIGRQPYHELQLPFKVPLVPLVPCLSIFINLYLMVQLDVYTWIRFVVWMIVGFAIYGFYGIRHSLQGKRDKIESEILSEKRKSNDGIKFVTKF